MQRRRCGGVACYMRHSVHSHSHIITQIADLKRGAEVVVATPGRLIEVRTRGVDLDCSELQSAVLRSLASWRYTPATTADPATAAACYA